jgi:HD-GYP domain-containing protein (c-di-GMP phosphodiesterase class II)
MLSDRPYRQAMNLDQALGELCSAAGTQFDPAVVDALVAEVAFVRSPGRLPADRPQVQDA